MEIGLLILRIVVGGLFIGHGTQKLFGWFGGPGPEGTGQFFGSLGYPRGKQMAQLAGSAEAIGGLLLFLGLATPLAAAAIIGVMVNAALGVHVSNGVWNEQGGYELPLVFGAAALTLAFTGPGAASLDAAVGVTVAGWGAGLAALVLGLVAGLAIYFTRETAPAPAQEAAAPAEDREYAESRR